MRSRIGLLLGGGLTLGLVMIAFVALFWTPYSPTSIDLRHRLAGRSADHVFGTDPFGRDELSMIMAGSGNSLLVAFVAVAVGAGVGVPLGLLAAARRGLIDELTMRACDLAFAFPALLTAVLITALAGPGAVNATIAIGIFNIPVFTRVARGSALQVWQREFVWAARVAGRGDIAISVEHVLPNIAAALIVQGTIQFAVGIAAEAGLSYVGLGAQPPQPSWGRMLSEAQTYVYAAPRLAIFPGLAITLSVLGLNLLGDGLRDTLDPALRRVYVQGAP
jgi:peptide/nickel transport system permease protein